MRSRWRADIDRRVPLVRSVLEGGMNVPSPLLLAHLDIIGRWCPGWSGRGHAADDLGVRAGRVLCSSCTDAVLADREARR